MSPICVKLCSVCNAGSWLWKLESRLQTPSLNSVSHFTDQELMLWVEDHSFPKTKAFYQSWNYVSAGPWWGMNKHPWYSLHCCCKSADVFRAPNSFSLCRNATQQGSVRNSLMLVNLVQLYCNLCFILTVTEPESSLLGDIRNQYD